MNKLLTAAVLLAAITGTGLAHATDLEVEVQGVASGDGEIMVAVFGDADTWLRKPVAVGKIAASVQQGGSVRVVLKDLPEGTVAFSVMHDVNGNGRLDRNGMGMPTEPYGFSNNAAGMFGPPKFEQATLSVQGASQRVAVKLN